MKCMQNNNLNVFNIMMFMGSLLLNLPISPLLSPLLYLFYISFCPCQIQLYYTSLCVCQLLSCVCLFATPWTIDCKALLSMGFPMQENWSGQPFPSPGDLPDPAIELRSPALQVDSLPSQYINHLNLERDTIHTLTKSITKCISVQYAVVIHVAVKHISFHYSTRV